MNPFTEICLGAVKHIPKKQYLIKLGYKSDTHLCVYKLSRVLRASLHL